MRRGCRLRGAVCSCGYPSGDRSMQRIQEAMHDGPVLFDEVAGVGVRGVVEDLLCRTAFHRLAVMHDDEPVSDERQHAEVMRDEDHGDFPALLDAQEFLHDGILADGVDGCRWLVGDDQRRLHADGQPDHDALQHAARELVRVLAQHVRRVVDAHQAEDVLHPFLQGPAFQVLRK